MRAMERWSEHTKRLSPLKIGDAVRIQNQTGQFPNKWDKTGRVVEVKQFDQYVVRVDGSGRVTLRNRTFLRKYVPVHSTTLPSNDLQNLIPQSSYKPIPLKSGIQPSVGKSHPSSTMHSDVPNLLIIPSGADNQPQPHIGRHNEPSAADDQPQTHVDHQTEPHRSNVKAPRILSRLETYNSPGLTNQPIVVGPIQPEQTDGPRRSQRLKDKLSVSA